MSPRLLAGVLLAALLCPTPTRAAAGVEPAPAERDVTCAECGMSAKVDSRFTSRIEQGGSALYFCDIGDLAAFIERTHPQAYAAAVRDFKSGNWIEAGKAFFVIDMKVFSSPMGWGVAAFRDREGAPGVPLDFEALRKALR